MEATLIQFISLVLLLLHPQSSSGHLAKRKSNLQFYIVPVPIGYGALSAYNALPSALRHAPYALRGLNRNYMSTKLGSVRTLDFEDDEESKSAGYNKINHPNYSLDLQTFVKLFAHEFQDRKGSKKLIK